jgi:ABC-2 type transport system permease protein
MIAAQYAALSRRSILNTVRQPTAIIPSLLFPLLFMAMSSAALNESTSLPGFPRVDSFMQFVISTTIIQGVLFGSIAAGADMATDIEHGFFERLIASPVARTSILVGRLMGAALLGFAQAWLYFGIGTIFGLDVEGGFAGMLLVSIVASMVAVGVGAISVSFALRTGSTEAVQGSFPLMFVALFLSSAFFPRHLMDGWFKSVADFNPLSHMIEGLRTQVITGIDIGAFLTAVAVAGGLFLIGLSAAGLALRGRLAARH